jgi:diguanylate cyclase (GGDEF)-like protein
VSNGGEILLLGEPSLGREFSARCGGAVSVVCKSDPYDALEEMSRRSWPAVVLTAPQPEFESLCRASRRLQSHSTLLAICSPAAEAEVRRLAPRVLDDYFIYPPTGGDWQSMVQAASGVRLRAGRYEPLAGRLTPREIAGLIESAGSVGAMEEHLAAIVAGKLGCNVEWVDADDVPAGARPLLLAAHDVPRALLARSRQADEISASDAAFVSAVQECLPAMVAAARRTESLCSLAITDHLTGAYNRRYFYLTTDQILQRAANEGFRVTLLIYDIDDFKRYNDAYGHAAGDEILRETAALMRKITRLQDIVARIGGDEFAVLFWDPKPPRSPDSKPLKAAYDLADRFRQAVRKLKFRSLGPQAEGVLTISGGLASFPAAGTTCRELLRSADRALRDAKEAGKDAIKLVGAD